MENLNIFKLQVNSLFSIFNKLSGSDREQAISYILNVISENLNVSYSFNSREAEFNELNNIYETKNAFCKNSYLVPYNNKKQGSTDSNVTCKSILPYTNFYLKPQVNNLKTCVNNSYGRNESSLLYPEKTFTTFLNLGNIKKELKEKDTFYHINCKNISSINDYMNLNNVVLKNVLNINSKKHLIRKNLQLRLSKIFQMSICDPFQKNIIKNDIDKQNLLVASNSIIKYKNNLNYDNICRFNNKLSLYDKPNDIRFNESDISIGSSIEQYSSDDNDCNTNESIYSALTENSFLQKEMGNAMKHLLNSSTITYDDKTIMEPQTVNVKVQSNINKTKKKNFACSMCCKSYSKRKSLVIHFQNHPGICPDCGDHRGVHPVEIAEHNKINHIKKYPFICDICGESFARKQHFKLHLDTHKKHKDKKTYKCGQCSEVFVKLKMYKFHIQETGHKKDGIVCDSCGVYFDNKQKLSQHVLRVHTREQVLSCRYCAMKFSLKQNLDRHVLLHTEYKKTYICDQCGATYFTQTALREHYNYMHCNDKEFQCKICNKQFSTKRALQIHQATHSDERPFKCNMCAQTYKTQSHLGRHKKLQHGKIAMDRTIKKFIKNDNGQLIEMVNKANNENPIIQCHITVDIKSDNKSNENNLNKKRKLSKISTFPIAPVNSIVNMHTPSNCNSIELSENNNFKNYENVNLIEKSLNFNNIQPAQNMVDVNVNCNTNTSNNPYLEQNYNIINNGIGTMINHDWQNVPSCSNNISNLQNNNSTKNKYFSIIEVNENLMQMPVANIKTQQMNNLNQEFFQYQEIWNANQQQIEYQQPYDNIIQPNTYNNIGSILTNLELIDSHSISADSNNYGFVQQKSNENFNLNDQNTPQQYNMASQDYSDSITVHDHQLNDVCLNYDYNSQSHTITDISNTFLKGNRKENIQQNYLNNNQNISSFDDQSNQVMQVANTNDNVLLPSLADYLQHPFQFNS